MKNGKSRMTEKQAARLVKRIIELGHTEAEAYKTLAIVMNAQVKEDKKKEASNDVATK